MPSLAQSALKCALPAQSALPGALPFHFLAGTLIDFFLNKGQGFIVIELDPGDINKGIKEI